MTDPLATIAAVLGPEEQAHIIRDRQQALARAAYPLALDLGVLEQVDVDALDDDARVEHERRLDATQTQIATVAAEIERLGAVADVPLPDVPQAPALMDKVAAVESDQAALRQQVRSVGVVLATAAGVPEAQAQSMIDQALA